MATDLVAKHYLEVKALTPVETNAGPSNPSSAEHIPAGLSLLMTGLLFAVALIGGSAYLFRIQSRELQKYLVVFLFALSLGALPFIAQRITLSQDDRIQAERSFTPHNVNVTNVTATSFTVTWQTDDPTQGGIRLLGSVLSPTVFLEVPSETGLTLHTVTASGLSPSTVYHFEVLSDALWYRSQYVPLKVITLPKTN